ncbi:hypothetical protein BD324DRAFT_608719 [Kockovaella imperatae]|uniref:Peroxin domain-containing protein n=1 Tax=Kockovaella imperatae TaxID=4999 RepID=A0A1Y1UHN4_9TREE|nr:hypothetical protein BD324DRAFT_608719 [Kockovaella imperatae]ORX36595.1 hypothetical protein BD324DRAFT_608719 [Kockovaella imperatae]
MSGPDHKHGSEDAEAGPSKAPYSPPASVVPPHTEYDEENFESIASSLEARRTERSIYHTLLGKKDKVKSRFEAHRAQRGYPVDDGEEEEEIEEGVQDPVIQEQRRDLRPATHAGIEALEAQDKVDGIVLIKDGEELKSSEEWTHEAVNMALEKPGYVWDVLFENQRGIFLLGKAYFSSRTLLPADPSPFTLPCRSLPSASSFTVSEPSNHLSNESTIRRTKADRSNAHTSQKDKKRSIVTAYTLDTFQTPSPAWKWVTPWMVNMKNGTDEAGWRYNVWFKKTGWRSHAGSLGANGYVRRREWVRLRCLPMEEEKDKTRSLWTGCVWRNGTLGCRPLMMPTSGG